jgi:hypothetical protein
MKLTLHLEPELYVKGKDLHHIKLFADEELIGMATQTVDELENLELQILTVLEELSKYRRAKQREEI